MTEQNISTTNQSQKKEPLLKVGETIFILGGMKGNIGEECLVSKIYSQIAFCTSKKTGQVYDKMFSHITKDPKAKQLETLRQKMQTLLENLVPVDDTIFKLKQAEKAKKEKEQVEKKKEKQKKEGEVKDAKP